MVWIKGGITLDNLLLQLLLVAPIVSAGVLALCYRANLLVFRRIALIGAGVPLLLLLAFVYQAAQHGSLVDFYVTYESRVSIFSFSYGMDSVSLWSSLISSLVLLAALMAAVYIKKRHKPFYLLLLLVQAVLLHIYASRDGLLLCAAILLLAFLFLLLIGIWGEEGAVRTARRLFYWQLAGVFFISMSCILLLSINMSYLQSSHVQLGQLPPHDLQLYITNAAEQDQRVLAFIMLLLGLTCFIPVIGLHRPFLAVYRHSHYVVSMLYSTTMGSLGIYVFYQLGLAYFTDLIYAIREPIIWIMGIQLLIAGISLWRQHELKGWLAYSVWGQYSFFIVLLLSKSELGLTMLWLQVLSFQLLAALLCILLAALHERTQESRLDKLNGSFKKMPYATGLFTVAVLGWIGLPGLSHFLGSYHTLLFSFSINRWITVLIVLGLISIVAYNLRLLIQMQHGQADLRITNVADLRFIEAIPAILLLTMVVVLGCYPIIAVDVMGTELHQLHRFWEHIGSVATMDSVNYLAIFDMNSEVWNLPVIACVVMSLAIWLVNHRQTSVYRMLMWQAVYHTLTLVVVVSSTEALAAELPLQRTVFIAIWYGLMLLGSYSMFKAVLDPLHKNINALTGLYHRKPRQAIMLLLFMLALMSAPLSAGFSYQLSMIELWSFEGQYVLILLWLVAHALMATIPLEYIIQMYMTKETMHEASASKHAPKAWVYIGCSCLALLLALTLWM